MTNISKSKFLPLFQVCIKGEKDQLMFHSDRFVRQKWKNGFFLLFPILTNVYTCCSMNRKKGQYFWSKKSSLGYVLSKLRRYNFNLV